MQSPVLAGVAVAVGFIALSGVTAEIGVIMLLYLDNSFRERANQGQLRGRADVDANPRQPIVEMEHDRSS